MAKQIGTMNFTVTWTAELSEGGSGGTRMDLRILPYGITYTAWLDNEIEGLSVIDNMGEPVVDPVTLELCARVLAHCANRRSK